jgi:hypothetical protein
MRTWAFVAVSGAALTGFFSASAARAQAPAPVAPVPPPAAPVQNVFAPAAPGVTVPGAMTYRPVGVLAPRANVMYRSPYRFYRNSYRYSMRPRYRLFSPYRFRRGGVFYAPPVVVR